MKIITESEKLWKESQKFIPGGVNSPVRAFKAVGGNPRFIAHASGSKIYDVDNNRYIDYIMSWGALILGHAHPEVVKVIKESAERGTSYGSSTQMETELAKMIVEAVPSIEQVRFVNSGTEATMSAVRLARGYTKRDKIVKFEGCYHGHVDTLLVKAGSGAMTFGIPDSVGIPKDFAKNTIALPYNDIETFKFAIKKNVDQIACVIVEPIAANMGVVLPQPGFLEELRKQTQKHGIILIFDEVITGFRVGYRGAQRHYKVYPDLTCLGKIIGGGLPVGAFGGKKEIMEYLAPTGPVYQAGTLSGNPLAMSAGLTTLKILSQPGTYQKLNSMSKVLAAGFKKIANDLHISVHCTQIGSLLSIFFTDKVIKDYSAVLQSDTKIFAQYFHKMLARGIYLAPSQFEAIFVSLAHTDEDIEFTLSSVEQSLKEIYK